MTNQDIDLIFEPLRSTEEAEHHGYLSIPKFGKKFPAIFRFNYPPLITRGTFSCVNLRKHITTRFFYHRNDKQEVISVSTEEVRSWSIDVFSSGEGSRRIIRIQSDEGTNMSPGYLGILGDAKYCYTLLERLMHERRNHDKPNLVLLIKR